MEILSRVIALEGQNAAQQSQIDGLDRCSAEDKKTLAAHARLLEHLGERLAALECRELAALDPPQKPRGLDVEVSTRAMPPPIPAIELPWPNGKDWGKPTPAGMTEFERTGFGTPEQERGLAIARRLAEIDARMAELKHELGTLRGERERLRGGQ